MHAQLLRFSLLLWLECTVQCMWERCGCSDDNGRLMSELRGGSGGSGGMPSSTNEPIDVQRREYTKAVQKSLLMCDP